MTDRPKEPDLPVFEGRVVHYEPGSAHGGRPGHCLAAIVVRNWGGLHPGALNLAVLPDGSNDKLVQDLVERPVGTVMAVWATSVAYEPNGSPTQQIQGHEPWTSPSWHFPAVCPYES